ncbi:uncharacterized protein I206_103601 [Kwoniella pini CBS 10737]|uniref:Major facilitator superfamily (MFS) profile domain-containing protein n=1 Tax=Kwoniella pini CBS 10737 TaxID=1296096 RepID=A0A1B9I9Q0_9TREE|nr:uncharacterized protein I206_01396 [Kwoniella pini CBS 10737]OCF52111.1 hypothetical protein I206_01396 [Kwoniella pini CBS 10737]
MKSPRMSVNESSSQADCYVRDNSAQPLEVPLDKTTRDSMKETRIQQTRKKESQFDLGPEDQIIQLSHTKKWGLLVLFSFSLCVDQWSYNGFFILTPKIAQELSIPISQQSWIVTSYLITFGSTILLFGRVSDLYSPSKVFSIGFIILAIFNLLISFLPELYSFFIFRALSGIAGASLVPSAFKCLSSIFQKEELGKALTIYTSAAPVGGASGVVIAGIIDLIPNSGQMSSWRWFCRVLAIAIFIPAIGSLFWIPKGIDSKKIEKEENQKKKFKKLDLGGSFLILAAVLLLILSLTMGGDHGFKTAYFIAPFIISIFIFPIFIWYESKLPKGYPLLPPSIFKIRNVWIFLLLGLIIFSFWSVNNFAFVNIWLTHRGESGIIVGVRLLPQAITSIIAACMLSKFSWFTNQPRIAITSGMTLAIAGFIMFSQSKDQINNNYWKFIFPSSIFASGGAMLVYSATSVGVMTSVPPSMSGTAGGLLQVFFQVGGSLALGIQAGMITINPGSFGNYKNIQASFYFEIGWLALGLLVFLVAYRRPKSAVSDDEAPHMIH